MSYYSIPYTVTLSDAINDSQKILFGVLYGFLNKRKSIKYSNQSLAKVRNCSLSKIKRDIKALEDNQFIERDKFSFNRTFYLGKKLLTGAMCKETEQMAHIQPQETQPVDNFDENIDISHESVQNQDTWLTSDRGPSVQESDTRLTSELDLAQMWPRPGSDVSHNITSLITSVITTTDQDSKYYPEPVVVISSSVDKELLGIRSNLEISLRTNHPNQVFLEMCQYHIEQRTKKSGIGFGEALNGLKKLLRTHRFEQPDGFVSPSQKEQKQSKIRDSEEQEAERDALKKSEIENEFKSRVGRLEKPTLIFKNLTAVKAMERFLGISA